MGTVYNCYILLPTNLFQGHKPLVTPDGSRSWTYGAYISSRGTRERKSTGRETITQRGQIYIE